MSQTPPPEGYLTRKVAQSIQEAISNYSMDHIKTIVKAAIQKYISSFFDTHGGNRQIFKALSKEGLKYITDRSFDPASDPTLRKTQLARLFENIRQELPCMLIMDTGFTAIQQNFTGLDKVWYNDNQWIAKVHVARNLKVMIAAGTRDQSSTDFLHGMLSVLFGEARFLSAGMRITGNVNEGETWVIQMGPAPELGTTTQTRVPEDPKDTIWTCGIELPNLLFEDDVTLSQPLPALPIGEPGVPNDPNLSWNPPPTILCPPQIPINQPARVLFNMFQPLVQRIIIVDPNIATFEPRSRMIYPRRLGTTQIQLIRQRNTLDDQYNNQTGSRDLVVASSTFTVVPA